MAYRRRSAFLWGTGDAGMHRMAKTVPGRPMFCGPGTLQSGTCDGTVRDLRRCSQGPAMLGGDDRQRHSQGPETPRAGPATLRTKTLYPGLLDNADDQGDEIDDEAVESGDHGHFESSGQADGEAYRNKTGISQWENLLGEDFLRIHRSYLVNRTLSAMQNPEQVCVGGVQLPVSRKYRDRVSLAFPPCR